MPPRAKGGTKREGSSGARSASPGKRRASPPGKSVAKAARRAPWKPHPPDPAQKRRALRINRILARTYPDARISLDASNPLELFVATVLSAQCTDARVNQVTPQIFARLRTARDYARVPRADLEEMIRPTGFFKNKARMIQEAARVMVERFGGQVPGTMEDLLSLPGVGRKTANVILGNAFETPGITVDTHVRRVSQRLGFTKERDPDRIEQELMLRIPRKDWTGFSMRMILHGRNLCLARRPRCERCPLREECPYPRGS